MDRRERKEYMREYQKKYYIKHRDRLLEMSNSRYHKMHPDALYLTQEEKEERKKERARNYREAHHDEYLEYQRQYREQNKKHANEIPVPMSKEEAREFLIKHESTMSYEKLEFITGHKYKELKKMYDEYFESIRKNKAKTVQSVTL